MDTDPENGTGSDENGNQITKSQIVLGIQGDTEPNSNVTNSEVPESLELSHENVGTAYAEHSSEITEVFIKKEPEDITESL